MKGLSKGRYDKTLSKGRYDKTFAGEDELLHADVQYVYIE